VAAFVRELLMRQDRGYAAGCEALAGATEPDTAAIRYPAVATGPTTAWRALGQRRAGRAGWRRGADRGLPDCGHWTALEAAAQLTDDLRKFF